VTLASRLKRYVFLLCSAFVFPPTAFAAPAAGGAQDLPWETPLDTFTQSITGPVAKWCIMIAIVASGLGLAFSEGGAIWRKALFVVLGGSIAFGAAALVATLGGTT
jgi:type IV secretory pathway VirB2 component (pilin)